MASAPMLLFNPLKLFVFPFVFFVALPLALCAGITTIVAFLVLFLRLFLVYFDVGLETLRYALIGHATHARYIAVGSAGTTFLMRNRINFRHFQSHGTPTPGSSSISTPSSSPLATTSKHRRHVKRHGSGGSGLVTPKPSSDPFSAVAPSIGLERDFEGVGGWRLESTDVDTDNPEEQQWCNLNSRLENPYRRYHFRSQSGGAVLSGPTGSGILTRPGGKTRSHSPEGLRRSPTPSRSSSRTPTMNKHHGFTTTELCDYFPVCDTKNMKKLGTYA
ncbi:hypothetical protein F5Y09DRAFT_115629 [Xylaria sp. FL1042]|nr:hypothetical protein F5Y09DRAFT_115629 [Xylaria sp. FL1042]